VLRQPPPFLSCSFTVGSWTVPVCRGCTTSCSSMGTASASSRIRRSRSMTVAVTKRVIAAQPGPVVLVGHSYGGVVITQAGNDPKVAGLVYIAAFAPDKGESVATLIANPAPGAPVPPILPPQDGFLLLDREKFAASFAADVPADLADFMANSQVPWGVQALEGKVSEASWKSKPSWYLVATDDRMIPPPAQQFMSKRAGSTVVESKGSHSVYVSQPEAVAALIETAARALQASGVVVK
jgi:pimeloyl-ACP methyl ester carboxylesterase